MAKLIATIGAPFIVLLSIPFAAFALLTTFFAVWILLFRVSIVYVELLAAFAQAYIIPSNRSQVKAPALSPAKDHSPRSKRASRSSSVNSDVLLRASPKSDGAGSQTTQLPLRDYEDVGGWRLEGEDREEALWMAMTSRPEMPPPPPRSHRRSFGSGSRMSSGWATPELVRTPGRVKTPGRDRLVMSGTGSPEGYFSVSLGAVSATEKSLKVSFDVEEPKEAGGSSGISLTSAGKAIEEDPT